MVAARVSRQSIEVVSAEPTSARVGRLDVEVATKAAQASASAARVSRVAIEVVGVGIAQAFVGRLDAEVATKATQASTGFVQVSRQSIEAVVAEIFRAQISRLDAEVAAKAAQATSVVPAQISRQSFEVVAREGSGTTVIPLPLATGIDVFLHNWATALTLRSRYITDVTIAASTGAESRRGLVLKPERFLSFVWELDENARMDRLLVMLRKLTDERIAVPLYCDQKELNAAYIFTDDTVFFDTTKGRWFIGGRVVIIQTGYSGQYVSHSFHQIASKQGDRLIFTVALGVPSEINAIIMPMMDCEVILEARMQKETDCHGRVELELAEVFGPSQLPAVKADFPSNPQFFREYPIFDIEPDWIDGIEVGRSRQGKTFNRGRSQVTSTSAARSRQTHVLFLSGDRDDMWRAIEFFDTRRGRLRDFFFMDKEYVWTVSDFDVAGTFVGIFDLGNFADFQEELLGGFIGIRMKDGTVYVREVITIQQVFTVFRLTLDVALPGGLNAADVDHVARARYTRFDSDEMVERWEHPCYMDTELSFIETLEEKIVST